MKTPSERLAALHARKERIETQIHAFSASVKATDRKRETRRKIVVGALILSRAANDAAFRQWLRQFALRSGLSPKDQALLAELLAQDAEASTSESYAVTGMEAVAVEVKE